MITLLVFLPILTAVLAAYLYRRAAPKSIWILAFGAFTARVGYVLADELFGIYAGGGDQNGYDATLWFVAQQWRSGVLLAPLRYASSPGNDAGYMLVYSSLFSPAYTVFGHVTAIPRVQMALVGTLVVVNIYSIGRRLSGYRAGFVGALLAASFPYWIVLSGIIYRDMLIVFFLTLMGYYFVRVQSGEQTQELLAALVLSAGIALSFRLVNLIAVGPMLAVAAALSANFNIRGYAAAGAVSVVSGALMILQFGDELFVSELAGRREWLARPNPGAYLSDYVYESIVEMIMFAPIGAVHFGLVPFPWHIVDLLSTVAFAQNVFVWYPVVLLSVVGSRDAVHESAGVRVVVPLAVFALAGLFGYGLVEGNVGPAIRHRSQFQFVFFVFAGVALSNRISLRASARLTESLRPNDTSEARS